ncbi:hypothetical protein AB1N83_004294 [Pleurotus pulmonarius]
MPTVWSTHSIRTMTSSHCGCTSRRLKDTLGDGGLSVFAPSQVKQRIGCCQISPLTDSDHVLLEEPWYKPSLHSGYGSMTTFHLPSFKVGTSGQAACVPTRSLGSNRRVAVPGNSVTIVPYASLRLVRATHCP